MTQRFGEQWTRDFTTAHERLPNNPATAEAMDLYNNQIGRQIAVNNPDASPEQLADLVEQLVWSNAVRRMWCTPPLLQFFCASESGLGGAQALPRGK